MGNRLSQIVTRTGDDGTTGLGDGSRIAKYAARVEVVGDVDELNSAIGVLLATPWPAGADEARAALGAIQHDLFALGGELATPGLELLREERVAWLDGRLAELNAALPPLKEFVLPGGAPAAAAAHVARTVCRRAERHGWALSTQERVGTAGLHYLNRLSDFLFVVSRTLARAAGAHETQWHSARTAPDSGQ